MAIADDWTGLKTDLRREAERLISRANGSVMKDRIKTDLTAMLAISEPNNDHELKSRAKIFDLFRTEWRTAVMENTHFKDKA